MDKLKMERKRLSRFSVNGKLRIPKYQQVTQILLQYINRMPEEEQYLPPQSIIEKELKVGKVTLRHSLKELEGQGIIKTSQRTGSKVLRKNAPIQEVTEIKERFLEGESLGYIFSVYPEDKLSDMPGWQIRNYFERLVVDAGGRFINYNSAEEKWKEPKEIVDFLKDNGIGWAFIIHDRLFDFREHIKMLLKEKIKPVLFEFPLSQVLPGADWIRLNCEQPLCLALEEDLSYADFVAYITGTCESGFASLRINALKTILEKKGILFREVVEEGERQSAGYSGATRILEEAIRYQHPLLIGANDYVAAGILKALHEADINIPDKVSVLGFDNFDNLDEFRYENLTTFDRDPFESASALLALCKEFYQKRWSTQESKGRIIFAKFIPRGTTKGRK